MIDIAFIWHMHQPYYKDDSKGVYMLPWVRLHGVKDYYPMAAMLEGFDNVRATFNLAPVLVEQIDDYAKNNASDIFLELTLKRPSGLTQEEKAKILDGFFKVNPKRFIEPNPRYAGLLIKKGISNTSLQDLRRAVSNLTDEEYLDLQVLFNLAWFHSITVESDPNLKGIVEKQEGYTEDDKLYVVDKQRQTLAQIIPLYKRLQDEGRIEITTTPYYHPILPLLCDTEIAKESIPDIALPRPRFSHPEDAKWQLESAMRLYAAHFGNKPRGMWPSEGSVSEASLKIMIASGIDWVVTDEDILFRSLSRYDERYKARSPDRRLVYQPYRLLRDSSHIDLIFRDKNLSNLISFSYSSWDPGMAALDLLDHFEKISESMRRDVDRAIVTIVMDGENAWEYYEDNGRKFFEMVYSQLDKTDEIETSTVSEYLRIEPPKKNLKRIFPGSWINHNFNVWIGSPQDNLAWQYLAKTRKDLAKFTTESGRKSSNIKKAWREIYIAEGSDWNWWYGPENSPGPNNPFDPLFRMHLKNVYKLIKKPVPDYLNRPIV